MRASQIRRAQTARQPARIAPPGEFRGPSVRGTPGILLLFLLLLAPSPVYPQDVRHPWRQAYDTSESIRLRIPSPPGYVRTPCLPGSFAAWLRHLPLKAGNPPVRLYNGREKEYQEGHAAVVAIDVGDADLQQCADAVIRLRSEYFFSRREFARIRWALTSGAEAPFQRWAEGMRPEVTENRVRWKPAARPDSSYASFRRYLDVLFTYAGSYSLERACRPVEDPEIGDIFIEGGFPGHAVIIVDMAVHAATGTKVMLLAQSYMPAQDLHILANTYQPARSPWYEFRPGGDLRTPEWVFPGDALRRLP